MKLTSGDIRTRRWLRDGACESLEGPRAGNRAPSRANRASVSSRRSQLLPVLGGRSRRWRWERRHARLVSERENMGVLPATVSLQGGE